MILDYIFKSTPSGTPDPVASGSQENLSANSSRGALMTVPPGHWSVHHEPVAATQATISKAAVAATRHVCQGFTATLATTDTAQATVLWVYLRDGASGSGTILWSGAITVPAGDVRGFSPPGLNIVGSTNTAMTIEFSGAGVANSRETVTAWGYSTT